MLEQYDDPATVLGAPATAFVADFVGADRGLRRMSVTPLTREDLSPATTLPADWLERRAAGDGVPSIRLGASLREGFAALAGLDEPALPVVDEEGRLAGVLTPADVHAALRRSAAVAAAEHAASEPGA